MATLSEAERLMEELREASYEPAKAELAEVQEFAKSQVRLGSGLTWLAAAPRVWMPCGAVLP